MRWRRSKREVPEMRDTVSPPEAEKTRNEGGTTRLALASLSLNRARGAMHKRQILRISAGLCAMLAFVMTGWPARVVRKPHTNAVLADTPGQRIPVLPPQSTATLVAFRSKIQHIVYILKENRSFDNYFGTFPGADGATSGTISTGDVIPLGHTPDATPRDPGPTAAIAASMARLSVPYTLGWIKTARSTPNALSRCR